MRKFAWVQWLVGVAALLSMSGVSYLAVSHEHRPIPLVAPADIPPVVSPPPVIAPAPEAVIAKVETPAPPPVKITPLPEPPQAQPTPELVRHAYAAPVYTLQFAAFHDSGQAQALAERLSWEGQRANAVASRGATGRTWHKVRLGAYPSRKDARDAATGLKRERNIDALIVETSQTPALAAPAVPGATVSKSSGVAYTLQLGAFRDPAQAAAFSSHIGTNAQSPRDVVSTSRSGTVWHKVRLGSFDTRAAAEDAADAIKHAHHIDALIVETALEAPPEGRGASLDRRALHRAGSG